MKKSFIDPRVEVIVIDLESSMLATSRHTTNFSTLGADEEWD